MGLGPCGLGSCVYTVCEQRILKLSSLLTITLGERQAFLGKANGERRLEETAPLREVWWTQSLPNK